MNQHLLSLNTLDQRTEMNPKDVQSSAQIVHPPITPSIFTLELTTICNNACSGCANVEVPRAKKNSNYVNMEEWEKIIMTIKPFAKLVRISGGEPTLHKDFFTILDCLEKNQIPHALLTTGRWGKVKKEKLLAYYKKCEYFVGLLVSLHGSKAETHNAFVQSTKKAFEETCANIKDAANEGLTVFTNSVLTNHSCTEVKEIVTLSQALGADYHLFNRFLTHFHPLEPDEKLLLKAIQEIENLRLIGEPCRVGNNIPYCFINSSSDGAKAGFELCHVSPSGEVRPDNLTHLSFGNLLNEDLKKLWDSPIAQLYRLSYPKECNHCKAFFFCRGGAKSITFQYSLEKDKLMKKPKKTWDPLKRDQLKDALSYLALTSD